MKKKADVSRKHKAKPISPEVIELLDLLKSDFGGGELPEKASNQLLDRLAGSPALYPELVEALVVQASDLSAPVLNLLLKRGPGKEERKQVKRALYRLRQKGFVWEEQEIKEESIWKPPQSPKARGVLSSIFPDGGRLVSLGIPLDFSRSLFMDAVVHHAEGVLKYQNGVLKAGKLFSLMDDMLKDNPNEFIEADPSYCRFLLEEARQISADKGKVPPPEFMEDMDGMSRIVLKMETHPLYGGLDKEKIRSNPLYLEKFINLLHPDKVPIPFIERSVLEPYSRELTNAAQSRIVLNEFQKRARKEEIYRRAVKEIFGKAEEVHSVKRLLEEIGYFMLAKGFEDDACAFAAAAMEAETAKIGDMLTSNSLLMAIVSHSLEVYTTINGLKEEEGKHSIIQRPQSNIVNRLTDVKA